MKVLIIEDEERLASHLKNALAQEGIIADYYPTGREGLNYIELNHETIDLIILDVMLPDISGINLCKGIRYQNISTPVIMVSARDSQEDKVLGLDAGADDYLVKPFSITELLARIRALLRRSKEVIPPTIKIGDLTMIPANNKITLNNHDLKLTMKEFRLLEYLVKHPDRVVDRETILDQLWDMSFDSFSNVIDVHIKNLRKKMEISKNLKIETVRGLGYRLKTI